MTPDFNPRIATFRTALDRLVSPVPLMQLLRAQKDTSAKQQKGLHTSVVVKNNHVHVDPVVHKLRIVAFLRWGQSDGIGRAHVCVCVDVSGVCGSVVVLLPTDVACPYFFCLSLFE